MTSANVLGHVAANSINIRACAINKSDHAPQRIIGNTSDELPPIYRNRVQCRVIHASNKSNETPVWKIYAYAARNREVNNSEWNRIRSIEALSRQDST